MRRFLLAVFLVACSSDPVSEPVTAPVCEAGRVVSCPCPGSSGIQTCADDGSGFDGCICPAGNGGSSGAGGQPGASGEAGQGDAGSAGETPSGGSAGASGEAGDAGAPAGNGGESGAAGLSGGAGQTGDAGAGGKPSTCEVTGNTVCSCADDRSPTAKGAKVCEPGASDPTCDCSGAPAPPNVIPTMRCNDYPSAKSNDFRAACDGESAFVDCRVFFAPTAGPPQSWIPNYCVPPSTIKTVDSQANNTYDLMCCKPVVE